jgi:hypothetical protein
MVGNWNRAMPKGLYIKRAFFSATLMPTSFAIYRALTTLLMPK